MIRQRYHKLFPKKKVCEHFVYCNVSKISGRDCADFENCQTYKFYQRYGNEPLGVGAADEGLIKRLRGSREWIE